MIKKKPTYCGLVVGIGALALIIYYCVKVKTGLDDSSASAIVGLLANRIMGPMIVLVALGGIACILASVFGLPFINLIGAALAFLGILCLPVPMTNAFSTRHIILISFMVIAFVVDTIAVKKLTTEP